LQEQIDLLDFSAPLRIVPYLPVGQKHGVGDHDFGNDAQPVSLDGGFGFRDLDDGVGQTVHDLGLGSAPRVLYRDRNPEFLEEGLGHAGEFGGHGFAGQIAWFAVRGVAADSQHPAGRSGRRLGINEIRDNDHIPVRAGFHHPVAAAQARIQNAFGHIIRNFLRPAEAGGYFRVIDVRKIVAVMGADFPAGPGEQADGGLFQ